MILRQLKLRNYKQYTELNLEFKTGLVGIIGRNGAGKSTIFDAILYCLFGKDEDKKETIRSTYAVDDKENIALELSFEIGDALFLVRREFKGKAMTAKANLYKNDQHIATDSDVNIEIVRLLKLDKDAFKRSVFSGQKEIGELSGATGEERKKMVRKILGLDKLEKIHQAIKDDVNGLKREIKGQRENLLSEERKIQIATEISAHSAQIDTIQTQRTVLEKRLNQSQSEETATKTVFEIEEQKRKEKNALDIELTKYVELSKNLQEQILGVEKTLNELEKLEEICKQRLPQIEQLLQQKTQLDEARETALKFEAQKKYTALILQQEEQIKTNEAVQHELKLALSEKSALDEAILALTVIANEKEQVLDGIAAEIRMVDKKISEIEGQILDRKRKIEQLQVLGKDADCPTCFQPLKERYETTILHFNDEIHQFQQENLLKWTSARDMEVKKHLEVSEEIATNSSLLQEKKNAQIRLQEMEKTLLMKQAECQQIKQRKQEHEVALEKLGVVKFDELAFHQLEQSVKNAEPIIRQHQIEQNNVEQGIPKQRSELALLQQRIEKGKILISEKTAALETLNFSEAGYQVLKEKIEALNQDIRALSTQVNDLSMQIKDEENKINYLHTQLEIDIRTQSQIAGKEEEITLLEKLSNYFGEFKTNILERITPTISFEASKLFSQITKGRYDKITVDEKYEFQVEDAGNIYPLSRFSGGEIDLANLCLRIALTKAIGELSGSVPLNFLAFDEVFGSQDEERRQGIMYALELLQEQFKQIYIISHIDSINDFFPHMLKVSLEEKGSVVHWVEG